MKISEGTEIPLIRLTAILLFGLGEEFEHTTVWLFTMGTVLYSTQLEE